MPKLNARGDIAAGRGGGIVSVNNAPVLPYASGEACWADDDRVVAQVCDGENCRLKTYHVQNGQIVQVSNRGANFLYGGGGVWAAWLGSAGGVYTSDGRTFMGAGLGAVGPDGAIAISVDYQAGKPWDVVERDGRRWRLTDAVAGNINLLGNGRAAWSEAGGVVVGRGIVPPQPVSIPFYGWRVIEIDGVPWACYQDDRDRLLLHPAGGFGYIATIGPAYRPDVVANGLVRVAWSIGEGEAPGEQRFTDINLTSPRVDLRPEPIEPPIEPPDPEEPTMPTYRDGHEDCEPYLRLRWDELRIPQQMAALAEQGASEDAYKELQCGALVQIAGELHHLQGFWDVGLSLKPDGNHYTLADGRHVATDIMTFKPLNGQGEHGLVDCLSDVGNANTGLTWGEPEPNTNPSRPWAQPPVPSGEPIDPIDPVDPVDPPPVDEDWKRDIEARLTALEGPQRRAIRSSRGKYLRDDWSDDTGKFDRESAGDGETYDLEPR